MDTGFVIPEFFQTALGLIVFITIALWSVLWKMFALYRSAARGHKGWFIALFFINTVGILEILYITLFSRKTRRI